MKRLSYFILAGLLALAPASAQSPQIRQLLLYQNPNTAAGGAAPTWTPGAAVAIQNNGGGGSATFAGLNGGVNFPAGAVVVVATGNDQSTVANLAPPVIGGVTLTEIIGARDNGTTSRCQMFRGVMTGSSTDTATISNGGSYAHIGVVSGYFQNLISSTEVASSFELYGNQNDPQFATAAINVPSSASFGIAALWGFNTGLLTSANTPAWGTGGASNITSVTGDVNSGPLFGGQMLIAHTVTANAAWKATVSGGAHNFNFIACMSVASWN